LGKTAVANMSRMGSQLPGKSATENMSK